MDVKKLIISVIMVVVLFTAGAALFSPLVTAGNSLNSSGMPLGTLVAGNSSVLALAFAAGLVIVGIMAFISHVKKK